MNLREIRQYIANIIDYDPSSNKDYSKQIDDVINHHYRMLFSTKEFTFAQRERKVMVYTDVTVSATGTYNSSTGLTTIGTGFVATVPTWAEGNIIEIDGTEYDVLYNNPVFNNECYVVGNVSWSGSKEVRFKQRYVRLPIDCVALLQVGRRSMEIAPTDVGRFIPLTRFEDEYYNLPLDEVNIPNYWIMQDDFMLTAPTVAPTVSVSVTTPGQGVRTVRVAQTYVQYGKNGKISEVESGLSSFTNAITLADDEILNVTYPSLPSTKPYARRIYIIDASDTPYFEGVYRVDETQAGFSGSQTTTFTLADFENGTFVLDNLRYEYAEGYRQTIRLYPRQNEDFELSCRYIYIPARLQEDTDTPELPPSHHLVLAYACLMDVLTKHDNNTLAGIYRRKYEGEVVKLEQRFLTQKPRRFVKGFMKESGVDTVPMWTPLRRTP